MFGIRGGGAVDRLAPTTSPLVFRKARRGQRGFLVESSCAGKALGQTRQLTWVVTGPTAQSPLSPEFDTGTGYAAVCGGVRADAAARPESVGFAGIMNLKPQNLWCPRQGSNLRSRFRKPMLSPLSYGG